MREQPEDSPQPLTPDPAPHTEWLPMGDGYRCFARWWLPPSPRAAVLYLHGIQSHGGWYEMAGADLARHGVAVLMPDRRGSGRNEPERGHVARAERWLYDTADWLAALSRRSGLSKCHLVGVSWGGKLAAAFAAACARGSWGEWRRSDAPDALRAASLTLVAPGVFPRIDLPLSEKMRIAWSLLSEPTREFEIPLDRAELFTANPQRIAYVRADPLRLQRVTGNFLLQSRRLDRLARELPADGRPLPVHLLLAGRDPIIDNDQTLAWFRRLTGAGHRLREYADAHHTLEFEPDPQPMRDAIRHWVQGEPETNSP